MQGNVLVQLGQLQALCQQLEQQERLADRAAHAALQQLVGYITVVLQVASRIIIGRAGQACQVKV